MDTHGKHAKDPQQVRVGRHGIATRMGVSIPYAVLSIALVVVICLVPFTIAQSHLGLDSQAFADSTRSAFDSLNDASRQIGEGDSLPTEQADYTSHVGAKMQNSIMSGGCELVSLSIALDSMGIPHDLDVIAKDYLSIDGHFATGYSGNPYSQGGGYPQGIAEAANRFFADAGEQARAHVLVGETFATVRDLVEKGYPVLVWTTMNFADPQFSGAFDGGAEWYYNEHCVVLYGFDGDTALVSDPLEGLVERDATRFANLYAQCGSMALSIF